MLWSMMPKNMIIRNIEIGLNLKLNFSLDNYINNVKSFQKKKQFIPMLKGNKVYGIFCSLSQYRVKLYDKNFEAKVHQKVNSQTNLLRYELTFNKMQPLKTLLYTVQDLKNKEVIEQLGRILVAKFNSISFHNDSFDTSILSETDRQLYYAGQHPNFWMDESLANPKGQYNTRAKHKRINQMLKSDSTKNFTNLMNELNYKLNLKIDELRK